MKRGSTIFLRGVVLLIGIGVLALCIFILPAAARIVSEIAEERMPVLAYFKYSFFVCLYGAVIPFFLALYQALKILGYIDKSKAFSELSIKALKNIKNCAIAVSILYVAGVMPVVYLIAEVDDAPGLILIGAAIAFAPIVIAAFAAVLQRLLQEAYYIKSENDLTV